MSTKTISTGLSLVFTFAFVIVLSACGSTSSNASASTNETTPSNQASKNAIDPQQVTTTPVMVQVTELVTEKVGEQPFIVAEEEASLPDPLNYLLHLRSISIELTSQEPDGTKNSTHIDIDSTGNMLIKKSFPLVNKGSDIEGVESDKAQKESTWYIVDGKGYRPSGLDSANFEIPPAEVNDDPESTVSGYLHGKTGVALWLDILPEGSLTAAGDDSVGGFNAHKYTVKGSVEGQEISGVLWYEPESGALIKADLVVPAALYNFGEENTTGQFTVKLETKKANVAEVKLPAAPILPSDEVLAPTAVAKNVDLPAAEVNSPPEVAASYPLELGAMGMGGMNGAIETSVGKIWLGLAGVGVQEWDAASGSVIQTIPMPEVTQFWDMKYDGKNLWVLASKENYSEADGLYVIDPAAKSILKEWHEFKDGDYGWQPKRLGLSQGKIWVANKIINSDTLEEEKQGKGFVLPAEAWFAYDGQKWIWASGSRCDGCKHDLWMFDTNNPMEVKDEDGTGEAGAASLGMPVVIAKGKAWVGAFKNIKTVNNIFTSDTYIDGYDLNQTAKPAASVDVSGEVGDPSFITAMVAGNRFLWLFGMSVQPPVLYYHDLNTGKVLGKVPVDSYGLFDIAFDGKDLWVLGMDKLVRISQP